jgi:hypothetical protein
VSAHRARSASKAMAFSASMLGYCDKWKSCCLVRYRGQQLAASRRRAGVTSSASRTVFAGQCDPDRLSVLDGSQLGFCIAAPPSSRYRFARMAEMVCSLPHSLRASCRRDSNERNAIHESAYFAKACAQVV